MYVYRSMHRQFPELADYAGNKWVVAVRLFGAAADAQALLHIPVALTEQALLEEFPCVTFQHGLCFVLCFLGGMTHVRSVALHDLLPAYSDDPVWYEHNSFRALSLAQDQVELSFSVEFLSYVMTSGLVLCNGVAKFRPPDILTEHKSDSDT